MSFCYFFFPIYTQLEQGERILKVIRCYASKENALNAKTMIQDLLVSELERMIDQPTKEKNILTKDKQLGSECA